jgi:hypothetical protein
MPVDCHGEVSTSVVQFLLQGWQQPWQWVQPVPAVLPPPPFAIPDMAYVLSGCVSLHLFFYHMLLCLLGFRPKAGPKAEWFSWRTFGALS